MGLLIILVASAGILLIAYAAFGMSFVYPVWKRWIPALAGAALVALAFHFKGYVHFKGRRH